MDTKIGMLALAAVCVAVLAIGFLKRKAEIVLNFLVRTVLGVMAIYLLNMLLAKAGMEGAVGINPISVLTVGSLGTGGVALLFGILFYNML